MHVLCGVRVCHPENQLPSEVEQGGGNLTSVELGREEGRAARSQVPRSARKLEMQCGGLMGDKVVVEICASFFYRYAWVEENNSFVMKYMQYVDPVVAKEL